MLTAVVLTKNNVGTIRKCLDSLLFCDKIIIIDNDSTDDTLKFAKEKGAYIYHQALDDFSSQRNFAMEKVEDGWILFVDADEIVSSELKNEILNSASRRIQDDNHVIAYSVRRQDIFLGKKLRWGEVRTAYTKGIIRLMKKGSGKWKGNVHETFEAQGPVGRLSGLLYHTPHPAITDFLNDINEYSTIRANELSAKGDSANILQIIFIPPLKFVYTYFLRFGFLDGPEGFIYSFMMSFHSFLVRSKLYLLQHK